MRSIGRLLRSFTGGGPWFMRWPRATVVVAAIMYALVFAMMFQVTGPTHTVSLLFTLPIALLAVAFGMRAGVLAGLVGVVLVGIWAVQGGLVLPPQEWLSRIAPMLLLGYLLGDAVDRLRRAEAEQRRLEDAARRQRNAIEINDTIVQGLSGAKWALESGDLDGGLSIVSDTLGMGQRLVSDLIRDADMRPSWTGGPPANGADPPSRSSRSSRSSRASRSAASAESSRNGQERPARRR